MVSASKRKKPAKKSPARPRNSSKAKPQARRSAGAATSKSDESDLVYSDIRRSLHGAILRNLR